MNIKNKKGDKKRNKGFTLVEMLVVISITVLLSSLAISYNRVSDRQLQVYRDQSTVVGVLNRAKVLALERFNEPPSQNISICAIGIRFPDNQNYYLFQDFESSGNCSESDYVYSGPSEDLESFSLGERVEFTGDASSGLEILFIPPHLDIESTMSFPSTITIESIDGSASSQIQVSSVGQITVQEIGNGSGGN